MKRLIYIFSICLLMIVLSSCGQKSNKLENMTTQSNAEYIAIIWEDRIYIPFCAINNSEQGVQIGIVDSDKNNKVYEYKGHSTDDWIISFYKSGEMDCSMLMKEINTTKIPDNLHSDYQWNVNF